ncbi:MAG TPA: VanZ family protein [Bacteroidales bacterium]|nr:VanZ family protein [Bacteroidales bacterium]
MEIILKHKKLFAYLFWLWLILILVFSLIPNGTKMQLEINHKSYRLDYALHFLVYFTFTILYLLWKADKYFRIKPVLMVYFFIGGLALAAFSEYMQTFIPGRTFNPFDFYANTLGIFAGIIFQFIVIKKE